MATYKTVPGSRGTRRSFVITFGLQEGYGDEACLHTADEVVALIERHLKDKAAAGQQYLTGTVTEGQVVYAWPEGPGKAGGGHEPQAAYTGEVSSLYNGDLTDAEVEVILNDLASEVGSALGQTRVYVAYQGDIWILQREESETPTGETV